MFCLVFFLLLFMRSTAASSDSHEDAVMRNILAGKALLLSPEDTACTPGKTYCVPDLPTSGIPSPSPNPKNFKRCSPTACTLSNTDLYSMTDGNLGSSYITRHLDRLEISAHLNATYDVSKLLHNKLLRCYSAIKRHSVEFKHSVLFY